MPLKPAAALLCVLGLLALPAGAATTCTVSATPLVFGNYNSLSGSAVQINATLTVGCLSTTLPLSAISYAISLGASQTSASMSRQMAGPSSARLNYNVGPAKSVFIPSPNLV